MDMTSWRWGEVILLSCIAEETIGREWDLDIRFVYIGRWQFGL